MGTIKFTAAVDGVIVTIGGVESDYVSSSSDRNYNCEFSIEGQTGVRN